MADSWSLRQLCDDGACTGVIGADGRCKVCGRAAQNWGDERRRGLLADEGPDEDAPVRASGGGGRARTGRRLTGAAAVGGALGAAGGDDFARRRLCPDGGCIGVLDERGVCKVCGASEAPEAAAASVVDAPHGADAPTDEDAGPEDGEPADEDGPLDEDADALDEDGPLDDDAADGDEDGPLDEDDAADEDGPLDDDDAGEDDGYYEDEEHDERLQDAGDDDRQLCPDGGCTGLLGADGRCKVCGRAGDAAP